MPIHSTICDDTPEDVGRLSSALRAYDPTFEIASFTDGLFLLDELEDAGFSANILFLDIYMPGIDGIETARKIRARKQDVKIIFVSTSREHYPQAYEVFAFNYLVKPFERSQLERVLDRAIRKINLEGGHKIRFSLLAGLVFVLLFTHIPVLYTLLYHPLTGLPKAEGGRMDGAQFSSGDTFVLDGEWEFYWDRLIVTEHNPGDMPDLLIRVPSYWSEYQMGGAYLPPQGVASYRLTLRGLSPSGPVTVYIPDFGEAYRVFLDGTPSAESGTVSRSAGEVFTVPQAKLYPVTLSEAETHEIVIEAAATRFSGLYMAPVLTDYNRAVGQGELREGIRFILFGVVLFSFFALAALFYAGRCHHVGQGHDALSPLANDYRPIPRDL